MNAGGRLWCVRWHGPTVHADRAKQGEQARGRRAESVPEAGFGQHQAVGAAFLTPVRADEQMLLLGGFWCPLACGVCDLWCPSGSCWLLPPSPACAAQAWQRGLRFS